MSGHETGFWRVCGTQDRVSRIGQDYQVVRLSRARAQIEVHVWPNSVIEPGALQVGGVVNADLRWRALDEKVWYSATRLAVAGDGVGGWLELLPRGLCADTESLDRLLGLFEWELPDSLVRFADKVLSGEVGAGFVTVPACFNYHHGRPSGLLTHSVDCARRFQQMAEGLPVDELAVGTIAALFHDIGKVRTLDSDGRKTALGKTVNHEALTLEMCAEALGALDADWPWAADMLRTIWTWRQTPKPDWSNQPHLALLVSTADRLSCVLDRLRPKARSGEACINETS